MSRNNFDLPKGTFEVVLFEYYFDAAAVSVSRRGSTVVLVAVLAYIYYCSRLQVSVDPSFLDIPLAATRQSSTSTKYARPPRSSPALQGLSPPRALLMRGFHVLRAEAIFRHEDLREQRSRGCRIPICVSSRGRGGPCCSQWAGRPVKVTGMLILMAVAAHGTRAYRALPVQRQTHTVASCASFRRPMANDARDRTYLRAAHSIRRRQRSQ